MVQGSFTRNPYSTIARCANRRRSRSCRVRAQGASEADACTARPHGGRPRDPQRDLGRLSADLHRGRALGRRRSGGPRYPARRQRTGRTDRRQQSGRRPRRTLSRSLYGPPVARAQQCECPLDGRAHCRVWPGGRDSGTLARDRLRRRAPPAPDRSDPRGGTPPGPLKGARRAREPYLKGTPAAGSFRTEREPYDDSNERAAITRAKTLFGADHANVQPHSGAQANMAVYLTLLKPGDTVLGMNLAHGGHLTHGHPLNFSGKLYTIVPYGVRKSDERIDYDELARLADEHHPKMIIVGASAYPRVIDFARIRTAADRIGAPVFTDMAHIAGLVAAGVHPSPVPHSDFVTTTTHTTLRGPRGGLVLCREQD